MAYRTFAQLEAELRRELASPLMRATHYDLQQAINDDYRLITQFANWNFLLDRYDIPVVTSYTTGTVNATVGSTTVTGVGTTWQTTWTNKKILLSGDNEEKEVAVFNNATTLTLRYPYNSTATTLTGAGYMIYQDSYPLPISPGRDLMICNPVFQWAPLKKWDRLRFDAFTAFYRFQAGLRPILYTDDGVDIQTGSGTIGQPKVQFWPLTTTAQDLVLRFFKQFTPLAASTDTTILPPEFEEVLIRLSKARLKQRYGIPGWTDDRATAMQTLLQFRESQVASPAFDYTKQDGSTGTFNDPYSIDTSMGYWPGQLSSWPGGYP
jgi:hypothetical protein